MAHTQSELQVITFAKDLCNYVMTITQKSPKQFRFSLIGRLQGYVLDIVEELYYANDIYVTPSSRAGWAQRQAHQRKAMSTLKLLSWVAQVSMEQGNTAGLRSPRKNMPTEARTADETGDQVPFPDLWTF